MIGGGDSDCENDLQEKRVAAEVTVKINSHKPELVMQRPGKIAAGEDIPATRLQAAASLKVEQL